MLSPLPACLVANAGKSRGAAPHWSSPARGAKQRDATGAYSLASELVSILAIHNNYFK